MIQRLMPLGFLALIASSVLGFFLGLYENVPTPGGLEKSISASKSAGNLPGKSAKLIPATSYASIPETVIGPTAARKAKVIQLPQTDYDLYEKVEPSAEAKQNSTRQRASRRAYNGAPPIIPHAIENTSDSACYACHGSGVQIGELKASVMSHAFLGNCTQCHAPPPPKPFQEVRSTVASRFIGLPAPTNGKRAYPGAPPTIPHSRWMRENCHACHGGPHGWAGMESTHPWRTNCTQCHAPSAVLDQMPAPTSVPMLPPLEIAEKR